MVRKFLSGLIDAAGVFYITFVIFHAFAPKEEFSVENFMLIIRYSLDVIARDADDNLMIITALAIATSIMLTIGAWKQYRLGMAKKE